MNKFDKARQALDDLDDYSRMEASVYAYGHVDFLEKFIDECNETHNALIALHEHMQKAGHYFDDSTMPLFKRVVTALYVKNEN